MKKLLVTIICIISSLCLISCNKVEEPVETTANEPETTKVNSTENEEETTISLYDTFLWDTEDPFEADYVELDENVMEGKLYNELQSVEDNIIFAIRVGVKRRISDVSREEEFLIYKQLAYNMKYNCNFYKLTENQLHSEVLSGNSPNFLFYVSKQQIYDLLNIKWPNNIILFICWEEYDKRAEMYK